jgi:hypothetical protein
MTNELVIATEGVRRDMLEGRSIDDAFNHACLVIANTRKHLQESERKNIALSEENERLSIYAQVSP